MNLDQRAISLADLGLGVDILSDVKAKKMLGANAFAHQNKVFCMVAKTGEMVFKFDVQEVYDRMVTDFEAKPWSPTKRSFGNWLELPKTYCDDQDIILEWAALAHGSI